MSDPRVPIGAPSAAPEGDPIYLDYNASSPLAPEALEAMLPFLSRWHGNAASGHVPGRRAARAVEEAREALARLVGARPERVVFTSGGTESNNWVFGSIGELASPNRRRLLISAVEHPSVGACAARLGRAGFGVGVVPVDEAGRISRARFEESLGDDVALASILLAQNEVGTLQPIAGLARAARSSGILFHTDGAQAVGKVPVDVGALGVDFLSIAGHKLRGPKGIGALWVREGVPLVPWMLGAPHESGLRAGTLNVPAIVGLGVAARLAREGLAREVPRLRGLSTRLYDGLARAIPGARLHGPPLADEDRLPNTVNVSFPGERSWELLARIPELAASAGAACHSGDPRPSATLLALGLPTERALRAVRFSLGAETTEEEVDRTVSLFARALGRG